MKSLPYLIIAAVVALAVWFLVAVPRIELAELGQATANTKVLELQRLDVERIDLIQNQQLQILDITENARRNRELLQTIAGQSRAQSRALQELKQNDKTIADYLRTGVPADLGRLYQRTATTDPSAYRQSRGVPTNTVYSAGSASAGD